ncbi:MAG TPA: 4-(cytidine 5'-diphospho)-2-C-methyl-D-erythritol kinase [Candidatus Sumerlaeota bacterium]|nr:4-(cytidine 5'-diphospho)-2-C-methyl-D-erythritol kinase [Candidatus Sumerlaeota bacterium]HRR30849.1 4-(cytidine 5'-diphospho)-2-C-methyl-D-erythritol kinase [Candidatus Sumerlaeia bacterium]HON49317.1 4-(cytidine 5'-diphospho)-2-C-methyl-D-erythritol kinase [Candidatus Sumerlaeota bacterium]HOR64935.1 4-(cytidine 5'-diphospho)-2-C-methyl-D-erythritol kinase [Candidatus Sumerlaeota bacterium]HPL73088.1 4-(cytidine 5'-diphospho)-2-C-methyl-D-erythritol kinase [Candidatus Sumerlaeota bacteriu
MTLARRRRFHLHLIVRILARAKINLYLDVLYKRPDGYHELDTLFQTVGLCDELFFEQSDSGCILSVSDPTIPVGAENLIAKAYDAVSNLRRGALGGVRIHLEKRIPHGAGLGGGSADAAATILALDRMFHLALSKEELCRAARQVGMDVPFCLMGGTARASGRGEILTPINRRLDFQALIIHPGFGVSTKEAYEALSMGSEPKEPSAANWAYVLCGDKVDELWQMLYNRFEGVIFKKYPILSDIKKELLKGGCSAALMTGSGSAVCGFAPPEADLAPLAASLRSRHPFLAITRPEQTGAVFINADPSARRTT